VATHTYAALAIANNTKAAVASSIHAMTAVAAAKHTMAYAIVNSLYVWHISSPPPPSNNKQHFIGRASDLSIRYFTLSIKSSYENVTI
jgi:hypothetical protein